MLKLPKRLVGKTNLKVSCLGLGCAQFGQVYGEMSQKQMIATMKLGLDSGINILDTAPYYGLGKSEENVGKLLFELSNEFDRSSYYLCTKIGRYGDDKFDFSRNQILSSIETSLNRLNTDYIDFVHCHDVEFASSIEQIWQESLPTLKELKEKGIIKNIGVSGMSLSVLDYICKNYGYKNIDTILTYNQYTLFNNELNNFIRRLKYYNIGIIQGGTTGLGLLTPQGCQEWHPAPDIFRTLCSQAIGYIESKYNNNKNEIIRLSFLYTLSNLNISSVLVGATDTDQLNTNLKHINAKLNDYDLENIQYLQDHIFAPIFDKLYTNIGTENNIIKSQLNYYSEYPSKIIAQESFIKKLYNIYKNII